MTIPFLPVDFVILAVLGLSGFFAAYRGFLNELLSILGWGLAAVITAIMFGSVRGTVRDLIDPDWFADIVGVVGLFLVAIIPISFLAYRVGEAGRQSSIGPLDRSMGFVYGVLRGLVVASLAYLIFTWLVPPDRQPPWIKEAKLVPIVERSSQVLTSLFNNKQPKGVSRSAPQNAPQQRPSPETRIIAVAEPPPPKPTPRIEAPVRRPDPTVPASEFSGFAPTIVGPEPTSQGTQPFVEQQPNLNTPPKKHMNQPVQHAERAKTSPKSAKIDARRLVTKPAGSRHAPNNQIASSERRPAANVSGDKPNSKGYGARDRQALDQLVRSTTREP